MKQLSPAKRSFRSRFLIVICIFVPMVLAMFMTTSGKGLPTRNSISMWIVRFKELGPTVQSVLIVDSRNPSVRITGYKAKDGDYAEVQMMLGSTVVSYAVFKVATPDVSNITATTRDQEGHEQRHSVIIVNVNEPKVEVKLGPPIADPAT